MKMRMNIFQPSIKSVFLPKLRWRPKKKKFLLKFSPVFGQKVDLRPPLLCSDLLPKLQRGGMPKFCILFFANYTILATQRRGGPMPPLNTPLVKKTIQKPCSRHGQVLKICRNLMATPVTITISNAIKIAKYSRQVFALKYRRLTTVGLCYKRSEICSKLVANSTIRLIGWSWISLCFSLILNKSHFTSCIYQYFRFCS